MFQFARFAFYIYVFNIKCRKRRVSPFGNPRIKVYSQLPRAYRSVSRPSSPLDAKASTKCTFIAWNIICTEINLHMIIKFSVWWLVKLFQTTIEWVIRSGGGERDRTDDLLLAKQALSQLSYTPLIKNSKKHAILVGPGRLELPTSRLSGVRSNRLSYGPIRAPNNSKKGFIDDDLMSM